MSSGPTGDNISYWATIKISKKMSPNELKALKQQIEALIAPHQGSIEAEARVSKDANPSFSFGFRRAPGG